MLHCAKCLGLKPPFGIAEVGGFQNELLMEHTALTRHLCTDKQVKCFEICMLLSRHTTLAGML